MENSITTTPYTYKRLKQAYLNARAKQKATFIFDGNELVTDYAKYLLEHMKGVLRI